MEFSVIVPVYNAKKNIRCCVESILAQSFRDFELILVDDGSRDESYSICLEYAEKDPRVVVVHQENQGPSAARNAGIERARGRWLCFGDSDDRVAHDHLEKINSAKEREGADAVFFGYRKINGLGDELGVFLPETDKTEKYDILSDLSRSDMFGYTWIKAFRRDAVGDVRFCRDINLLEDEVFACQVLKNCNKVSLVPEPLYYYTVGNEGSLIGRTHEDYCRICDIVFCAWRDLLSDHYKKEAFLRDMAKRFVNRCKYYGFEREVEPKAFFRELSETEFLKHSDTDDAFGRIIASGNIKRACFERKKYRMKQRLARLLGRHNNG